MRAVYLFFTLLIPIFYLLPLSIAPRQWAAPDVLLALSFAWAVRRMEYVPTLSILAAFFMSDLLLQRPLGLLTALALIGLEWAKGREGRHSETTFIAEWLTFGVMVVGILLGYRAIMLLVVAEPGPLHLAVIQAAGTIAIYPLVVLFSHFIIGVRRITPGEYDAFS